MDNTNVRYRVGKTNPGSGKFYAAVKSSTGARYQSSRVTW